MRYTTQVISYSSANSISNEPSMAFRQPTAGPELDIVHYFCEEHLKDTATDNTLSIFLEPKLESGFPDIVAVFWDSEVVRQWPEARKNLQPSDISIIHYVNMTERLPVQMLVERFGTRKASEMMLRLSDAHAVEVSSEELVRKPLEENFAIKRLVAIEAKVKDWRKGLDQAFQNTWFASEAYLLLGAIPQSTNVISYAERLGVGLLHKDQPLSAPQLQSRVGSLPASHATWFFNEWVWKYDLLMES